MAQVKHISYYTNVMASWSKPDLGAKPSEAQLALAHVFGRPGKQSMAVAMALRDGGVTGKQIKGAAALFDGKPTPQLNHMRDLISEKLFTREAVPGAYVITLAPKGQQFVDLHGAKAAEKVAGSKPAAKAAAKAASRPKGKGKAVTKPTTVTVIAPTSEAPTVSEAVAALDATGQTELPADNA
jgi:hypothetical protein